MRWEFVSDLVSLEIRFWFYFRECIFSFFVFTGFGDFVFCGGGFVNGFMRGIWLCILGGIVRMFVA